MCDRLFDGVGLVQIELHWSRVIRDDDVQISVEVYIADVDP